MKITIYVIAVSVLFLSACKNDRKQTNTSIMQPHMEMHTNSIPTNNAMPMNNGMAVDTIMQKGKINNEYTVTQKNETTTPIINAYLLIKNGLVSDNNGTAKKGAKMLLNAITKFDMSKLTEAQHKNYMDIIADTKENAEHISDSPLEHQREHFVSLSIDINDLVTLLGTSKTLYKDYCPMAADNKGASWLSETKEISNPYLGSKMPTCGTVQKQIN